VTPTVRILFLGALPCSVLAEIPAAGLAQPHDAHPPSGAPAPQHDRSGGAGAGDAASRETTQHVGESPAEMTWSMGMDFGSGAYQHGP
jgi:hypothetical protein